MATSAAYNCDYELSLHVNVLVHIRVHVGSLNALPSKCESVKFSLIESMICLFTHSSVKKYFSLLNQFIFTDSPVEKIFFTIKSVNFH